MRKLMLFLAILITISSVSYAGDIPSPTTPPPSPPVDQKVYDMYIASVIKLYPTGLPAVAADFAFISSRLVLDDIYASSMDECERWVKDINILVAVNQDDAAFKDAWREVNSILKKVYSSLLTSAANVSSNPDRFTNIDVFSALIVEELIARADLSGGKVLLPDTDACQRKQWLEIHSVAVGATNMKSETGTSADAKDMSDSSEKKCSINKITEQDPAKMSDPLGGAAGKSQMGKEACPIDVSMLPGYGTGEGTPPPADPPKETPPPDNSSGGTTETPPADKDKDKDKLKDKSKEKKDPNKFRTPKPTFNCGSNSGDCNLNPNGTAKKGGNSGSAATPWFKFKIGNVDMLTGGGKDTTKITMGPSDVQVGDAYIGGSGFLGARVGGGFYVGSMGGGGAIIDSNNKVKGAGGWAGVGVGFLFDPGAFSEVTTASICGLKNAISFCYATNPAESEECQKAIKDCMVAVCDQDAAFKKCSGAEGSDGKGAFDLTKEGSYGKVNPVDDSVTGATPKGPMEGGCVGVGCPTDTGGKVHDCIPPLRWDGTKCAFPGAGGNDDKPKTDFLNPPKPKAVVPWLSRTFLQ